MAKYTGPVLKRALFWAVLSVTFGMFQVWYVRVDSFFGPLPFDWDAVFKSGTILFFSSAAVVTSAFDMLLYGSLNLKRLRNILFHFLLPMLIITLICILYSRLLTNTAVMSKVEIVTLVILPYSLVYSTMVRILLEAQKLGAGSTEEV